MSSYAVAVNPIGWLRNASFDLALIVGVALLALTVKYFPTHEYLVYGVGAVVIAFQAYWLWRQFPVRPFDTMEKLLNWRIGPEAGEMGMGKFSLHHYVVDGLICVPSWRAAAYAGPRHLREER